MNIHVSAVSVKRGAWSWSLGMCYLKACDQFLMQNGICSQQCLYSHLYMVFLSERAWLVEHTFLSGSSCFAFPCKYISGCKLLIENLSVTWFCIIKQWFPRNRFLRKPCNFVFLISLPNSKKMDNKLDIMINVLITWWLIFQKTCQWFIKICFAVGL